MSSLLDMLGENKKPEVAEAAVTSVKGKGNIPNAQCFLMLGDHIIFSRGIWEKSTSPDELQNEINDLFNGDSDKATKEKVIHAILSKCSIRITNGNRSEKLADFLK